MLHFNELVKLLAQEYRQVKNILMAVKDCETTSITSPIVGKTLELASMCSSKVYILHIAPPTRKPPHNIDSMMFSSEVANGLRHKFEFLKRLEKCMQDVDIDATALLVQGSIINTILKESERLAVDLVILGRNKHGPLYRTLMDDTDKGLLAKCSRPIMFAPL
jgi:nucleotide-binding universal stress UspA family protein